MVGIVMYSFDTVKNHDQYLSIGCISLQQESDLDHLMAVIISTHTDLPDVSRLASIFICTIWSRPGLFVPTLFVMHDQLLI
ncbi:hypothetical protein K492DRAFT_176540 [Lichtheimia hyalospora FSU 10163]|nr:hypothetical protein K492DRAFT_176540 [Lichtheimia hyalospora FSU 10163]